MKVKDLKKMLMNLDDDFEICLSVSNEDKGVYVCDDFEMDVDEDGEVINLFGNGMDVNMINGVYERKFEVVLSKEMVESLKDYFKVSEDVVIEELDDLFGGMNKISDMVSICESLNIFDY